MPQGAPRFGQCPLWLSLNRGICQSKPPSRNKSGPKNCPLMHKSRQSGARRKRIAHGVLQQIFVSDVFGAKLPSYHGAFNGAVPGGMVWEILSFTKGKIGFELALINVSIVMISAPISPLEANVPSLMPKSSRSSGAKP